MNKATKHPNTQNVVAEQDKGRCAPAAASVKLKVGDTVEATGRIWRFDRRSELSPGDRATVSGVWQTTPDSPQIIGLEIEGKAPMRDIVCLENTPLRLVSPR
jgi:hypothetical protein